jgi:hypothetical protein
MGDVNGGHRAGAKQSIHLSHKKIAMSGVESLARLIKNQQAGIFDERARQENHALKTSGKGKERIICGLEQVELLQPPPRSGALARCRRFEQTDGVVKT